MGWCWVGVGLALGGVGLVGLVLGWVGVGLVLDWCWVGVGLVLGWCWGCCVGVSSVFVLVCVLVCVLMCVLVCYWCVLVCVLVCVGVYGCVGVCVGVYCAYCAYCVYWCKFYFIWNDITSETILCTPLGPWLHPSVTISAHLSSGV
jgi:hypothetical protein